MAFLNQYSTHEWVLTMTENKELIFAKDSQQSASSLASNACKYQIIERWAFLKLPVAHRNALLAQQVPQ